MAMTTMSTEVVMTTMSMEMVMLTWERNLLTLLLGGWLTLPGRFLPRSWNLSVIFLWGEGGFTECNVHVEKNNPGSKNAEHFFQN